MRDTTAGGDLLTVHQVVAAYPISQSWLAHARVRGTGPRFCRFGRKIAYRRDAIEAYLAERTFVSTSQAARVA